MRSDTTPDSVIIDAGSSESRVYVYKWSDVGNQIKNLVELVPGGKTGPQLAADQLAADIRAFAVEQLRAQTPVTATLAAEQVSAMQGGKCTLDGGCPGGKECWSKTGASLAQLHATTASSTG